MAKEKAVFRWISSCSSPPSPPLLAPKLTAAARLRTSGAASKFPLLLQLKRLVLLLTILNVISITICDSATQTSAATLLSRRKQDENDDDHSIVVQQTTATTTTKTTTTRHIRSSENNQHSAQALFLLQTGAHLNHLNNAKGNLDVLSSDDNSNNNGPFKRLLVRQLTNLMINNELVKDKDSIGKKSSLSTGDEGEQLHIEITNRNNNSNAQTFINGENLEENYVLINSKPSTMFLVSNDDNEFSSSSSSSSLLLQTNSPQLTDLDLEQNVSNLDSSSSLAANNLEEQYVTCPPDYEDQVVELSSGNLTSEQQQQLLAGADSSGLLNPKLINNSNSQMISSDESINKQNPIQCYHPGSKMIEMITKVITPILFTIIIIVGLVGNIIVMLVILEDRKTERELTPTGLLILDLSLADLSFIIFCIPFTGWDYSVGHWVFGSLWCKFNQYLIVVCALSSIYTLVLMSIDRFMAIVYPIECLSYRTSKNTLYAIYIKWILILLMASPTIRMHGLIDSPLGPDQYTCRFLTDQYNPLHFQIIFFITSYLFPLILIFCLYLSLLNKLWFGSKPHGHKESLKTLESKKKVTWLVAGIVVVFALCWCPIQVMLILMRLKSHKITATYVAIQVFSHTLGYMNSCVNPIVYAFASETFLNSFKRSSLGRFCYRCLCLHNNHNDYDRSATTRNTTMLHNNSQFNHNSPHHPSQQRLSSHNLLPDMAESCHSSGMKNCSLNNDINHSSSGMLKVSEMKNQNRIVSMPLEPRDRIIFPQQQQQQQQLSSSTNDIYLHRNQPNNNEDKGNQQQLTSESSLSSKSGSQHTKQQLVARVIQSSNQVSHRCEPCYQREIVNP